MSIPQDLTIHQIDSGNMVSNVLKKIKIGTLLSQCNFNKRTGGDYSVQNIIYRIMVVLFLDKSMRVLWEEQSVLADCYRGAKKDSYYRLLKNHRFNWRNLLLKVFVTVSKPLARLSDKRKQVLIIDDTCIKKRGKKIELLSYQYDHSTHQHFRGFTQVFLGWSDGLSFLPVDFCVKAGKTFINNTTKKMDRRTVGAKRRKETTRTKLEQSLEMLKRAYSAGVEVGAVVYDTWFAKPQFLLDVFDIGYNSICQLPKNDRIWQFTNKNRKRMNLKEIYRMLMAEKTFSKMKIGNIQQKVASIILSHPNGLELKLVFCKTKHKKEWVVFASTDTSLSDYDVLEMYTKRWQIETFFKESKQILKLGKEQSIDFDVQIAMTTIRAITYSLTVAIKRDTQDERTLGKLFEIIQNEFSSMSLDKEILMLIFESVLTSLDLPLAILWKIQDVFNIIANNFCSGNHIKKMQAA